MSIRLSDFLKGHNEKELLPIMKEKFFIWTI